MRIKTLAGLFRDGQISLLLKFSKWADIFYKLDYITVLFNNGFAEHLSDGSKSLEELAKLQSISQTAYDALEAWLQVGVRLKLLRISQNRYSLAGFAAKLLQPENDALLAIIREITTLHHKLILDTPKRLREGNLWTLQDQEGDVIARSSRIVEPLQRDLIASLFPSSGAVRLLEIGCGSGIYIKYAAENNPQLIAIGIDLQDNVVAMAQKNIADWGLQERVQILQGDVWEMSFENPFDVVTLYNNIYYFPVDERVNLLKYLLQFLKPGGMLVLTTACQGGQPLEELLNLWGASTEGCGRLPYSDEMVQQMEAAGFVRVQKIKFLPGVSFYAFVGRHP